MRQSPVEASNSMRQSNSEANLLLPENESPIAVTNKINVDHLRIVVGPVEAQTNERYLLRKRKRLNRFESKHPR